MKIFISYSQKDKQIVERIHDYLIANNHEVWIDTKNINPGDNIVDSISKGLEEAEIIIVIISKNSLSSVWVQQEFSAIALQQIANKYKNVIPIKIDNSEVPNYLSNRLFLDLNKDFSSNINKLLISINEISLNKKIANTETNISENIERSIRRLNELLRKGRLTIFCGAGVSIDAGIPSWEGLLVELLEKLMTSISKKTSIDVGWKSAKEFISRNNTSTLILGKYLKNNLGNDFTRNIRDVLYRNNPLSCDLIDSIVSLARPQRNGNPLDSIISFNFDDLIEENLFKNEIPNKAIYSEAIYHDYNELAIYHVHGFLPRKGNISELNDLVFSEDSYHNQFIDPFSWSNLIQLNKLTQNTCLLVGISLTDPNMRRLLDVAWRKNPNKYLNHYIIKKTPQSSNKIDPIDKVSQLLEEQDANALGLNVIWVSEYHEIPKLLLQIAD